MVGYVSLLLHFHFIFSLLAATQISIKLTHHRYTCLATFSTGVALGTLIGYGKLNTFYKISTLCLYTVASCRKSLQRRSEGKMYDEPACVCFEIGTVVAMSCVWISKRGGLGWIKTWMGRRW